MRALAGRRESRRFALAIRLVFGRKNAVRDLLHGELDIFVALGGSQLRQIAVPGQLHVGAEAIGPLSGFQHQSFRCAWNSFQVNISAEAVIDSKELGHAHQLFHRVIGTLNNARAEKQPFDVIPFVKFDGEEHNLFGGKPRPGSVAGDAIDAIAAVIDAIVCQQQLEQGNTASVRCIAVANPDAVGVTQPARNASAFGAAAGARGVVLGSIGQNTQLLLYLHPGIRCAKRLNSSSFRLSFATRSSVVEWALQQTYRLTGRAFFFVYYAACHCDRAGERNKRFVSTPDIKDVEADLLRPGVQAVSGDELV